MNQNVRITSQVIRIRGHFLLRLNEWQCSLAKHGIAAGESDNCEVISMHLSAVSTILGDIAENGRVLGFEKVGVHATQVRRMMDRFLLRCLGQANQDKLLTDVILELNKFVLVCRSTAEQPTVLEGIDLPELSLVTGDP